MAHLFAYGTLMCPDIIKEVTGLPLRSVKVTLYNFRRLCVKQEPYPALISNPGSTTDGVLYRDIPHSAWIRLDQFEGQLYSRERVPVLFADGTRADADTYVVQHHFQHCLEEREWDFEQFIRQGKDRFCNSYKGYDTIHR